MLHCSLYCRGIDINADSFHGRREHGRHRERMLNSRQQQSVRHIGEFFTHDFLRFDRVCCYSRNRSLVTDRAGQHDIDVVTDAGMHDAAGQNLFLSGRGDSTCFADYIDRSHEVLVPAACERQLGTHSQRSAEQRPFDVVSGKRISGKKTIDVSRFDEAHQMLAGTSPHNRRPGDHCDFAFGRARPLQFTSQLANDGRFRFVGIDNGVDELKKIRAGRRTLHRHDAHALVTNHNLVAFTDVEELYGSGGPSFSIHNNRAVHHGRAHFDLFAVKPDEGLLVGRHVKVPRKNAVRWCFGDLRIRAFVHFGAVLS